jgi:hypothetical protein
MLSYLRDATQEFEFEVLYVVLVWNISRYFVADGSRSPKGANGKIPEQKGRRRCKCFLEQIQNDIESSQQGR